jgi:hypothetical protein
VSSPAHDEASNGLAPVSVPESERSSREPSDALRKRTRMLAALAGILAGLASFAIGESVYKIIPAQQVRQVSLLTPQGVMAPSVETQIVASARNASLAFGVLGLCLAGFMGMAGGLARRSTVGAVTAGLLGMLAGAVLCAGISLALIPLSLKAQYDRMVDDVLMSLITHGLFWGSAGASAGMAFALGLGERRKIVQFLAAGLLGAFVGAATFELIGALFFNDASTTEPISETWPTRLLARLLVTIGTGAALTLSLPRPRVIVAMQVADTG